MGGYVYKTNLTLRILLMKEGAGNGQKCSPPYEPSYQISVGYENYFHIMGPIQPKVFGKERTNKRTNKDYDSVKI